MPQNFSRRASGVCCSSETVLKVRRMRALNTLAWRAESNPDTVSFDSAQDDRHQLLSLFGNTAAASFASFDSAQDDRHQGF